MLFCRNFFHKSVAPFNIFACKRPQCWIPKSRESSENVTEAKQTEQPFRIGEEDSDCDLMQTTFITQKVEMDTASKFDLSLGGNRGDGCGFSLPNEG